MASAETVTGRIYWRDRKYFLNVIKDVAEHAASLAPLITPLDAKVGINPAQWWGDRSWGRKQLFLVILYISRTRRCEMANQDDLPTTLVRAWAFAVWFSTSGRCWSSLNQLGHYDLDPQRSLR